MSRFGILFPVVTKRSKLKHVFQNGYPFTWIQFKSAPLPLSNHEYITYSVQPILWKLMIQNLSHKKFVDLKLPRCTLDVNFLCSMESVYAILDLNWSIPSLNLTLLWKHVGTQVWLFRDHHDTTSWDFRSRSIFRSFIWKELVSASGVCLLWGCPWNFWYTLFNLPISF